jgi:hypothetical protein
MKLSGVEAVLEKIGDDLEVLELVVDLAEVLSRRRRKKRLKRVKRHLTTK